MISFYFKVIKKVPITPFGLSLNIAILFFSLLQPAISQDLDKAEEQSLINFSTAIGIPVSNEKVAEAIQTNKDDFRFPLQKMQNIAQKIGLTLQKENLTIGQLRQRGGPAILHMREPTPFLTLTAIGPHDSIATDSILNNTTLLSTYLGEALVLATPYNKETSVFIDDPVRRVKISSTSQEVSAKILVLNRGYQDLHLVVASTSCSCTGAELSLKTIAPGQAATLTTKMQAEGWGSKTVTVTLHTDDPLWPRPIIALQTETPKTIVPTPTQLLVSTSEGQTEHRKLALLLPPNVSINNMLTRLPFVSAKLMTTEPFQDGIVQHIDVTIANPPAGAFNDELTITLKGAEVSKIGIPITGLIDPDVRADPHTIFLNKVSSGSVSKHSIIIRSQTNHDFTIKSIKATNPNIVLADNTQAKASSYEIHAEIKIVGEPDSLISEAIRITLSNNYTFDIPVVGMIARSDKTSAPPNK